ncbi:MAG: glycosyltransferase family 39 protein [Clostridia bacterium]|nr:glycosyltransferase family 39 protein [Clostridia bacterium]
MFTQFVFLLIYILFAACICRFLKEKYCSRAFALGMFLAALLLRIVISFSAQGYQTDMNCFRYWSMHVASTAPWRFYDSIWCDYPPGYLYFLAPVGFLKNIFPAMPDRIFNVLIKLPACICDILGGFVIYKLAKKHLSESASLKTAALYIFCPAVILNSAVWGQADSVFALFLLLSLLALSEEKYYKSAALLGLSMAVKFQTVMFAPVFLFVFLECVKKDRSRFKTFLICIGIFLAVPCVSALPFAGFNAPAFLTELGLSAVGEYPYASLNAFGFFSILGANLSSADEPFLFLTYAQWGIIFTVIIILLTGRLYLKGEGKGKIIYTAAVFITLIYVFSSGMHERYLFPAVLLFTAAYCCSYDRKTLYIAGALALSQYINVGYLYNMAQGGVFHIPPDDILLKAGSLFTLGTAVFAVYNFRRLYMGCEKTFELKEENEKHITRKDVLFIAVIAALYSVVAFINLGDKAAPETAYSGDGTHEALITFDKEEYIGSVIYYKGLGDGSVEILSSTDGVDFQNEGEYETDDCFRWQRIPCAFKAKYVWLRTLNKGIDIYEAGFTDIETGEIITSFESDSPWFDEQNLVPDAISFKNGTYFDEIYHVRTAYENLKGIYPYEISHPPLGKLLIAAGIKMFGMNPLGWRFMGTLFGIFMLPLMYVLAKRIFKNSNAALIATLLLAFDFMHFTQTRIATIDSFGVFFIMLMYYFMYIYYDSSVRELPYKKALGTLALCGLSFALGAATKWICVYSGPGLAVLFAAAVYRREKEDRGTWFKTCLWCILFFTVVPALVYFVSYMPYYSADGTRSKLAILWENQKYMLSYHGSLTATHPFQSKWFTWPFDIKPIWYYGAEDRVLDGVVSSIVGFGNPVIWWFGAAAVLAAVVLGMRNKKLFFICTAFLSQYLPWALITRAAFIYHYFASVPFVILTATFALRYIYEKNRWGRIAVFEFLVICGMVFYMFYPVLSGMPVSRLYVKTILTWLETWKLSY